MKKKAVIKSARGLKMVTNLVYDEVINKLGCFSSVEVNKTEYVKGLIYHITISDSSRMLCKCQIDRAWEVIDEFTAKYDDDCIFGTIQCAPYISKSGNTLYMPTIEIVIRVKQ